MIESAVTKTHTYSTGHLSLKTAIYHFLREQFLGKSPLKTFFFSKTTDHSSRLRIPLQLGLFFLSSRL